MKHRIVHTLQKYLLNPPIKLALAMGLPLPDMRRSKRQDQPPNDLIQGYECYRKFNVSLLFSIDAARFRLGCFACPDLTKTVHHGWTLRLV
jgi:hypothetical protein